MIFRYQTEIEIKKPIDEVFEFFSRAENLEKITPPLLRFKILSPLPIKMESGAIINYRLSLYHLPLHWQSEITAWEPPYRFINEQRQGPYKQWIHEHIFTETGDGCQIEDKVQYQLYCPCYY